MIFSDSRPFGERLEVKLPLQPVVTVASLDVIEFADIHNREDFGLPIQYNFFNRFPVFGKIDGGLSGYFGALPFDFDLLGFEVEKRVVIRVFHPGFDQLKVLIIFSFGRQFGFLKQS